MEIVVVCMAIAIPASAMLVHKYWLHSYFSDADLRSWLLITLGLPLAPFFLWAMHLKRQLVLIMGNEYKNDLIGEITALRELNDQKIWSLYKRKSRVSFIAEFFAVGQIALAYAAFAYYS